MAKLNACETELPKPSVLKEGHLLKLGRSMLKLPKLNYYVLKPSGVYCFTGKQDNDILRGFIPLDEISLSLGTVGEANSHLHCIKIADKRKVHVLACHSKEIRDSWITAILTAVAERLVHEPNIARKRLCSSGSSSDSEVFCDLHCQFTSPFWANQEGERRESKAGRMSVSEIITQKTSWVTKNKKKNRRSKSLSCEDIPSLFSAAQRKPSFPRKPSMDFTRHLLWPSSSKTTAECESVDGKVQVNPTKASGKKRWSLFNIASFGWSNFENGERKLNCATKHEPFYEQGSQLICDTKL